MRVKHNGKPGTLMNCGAYLTFNPDKESKKKGSFGGRLMIEPDYSIEMLMNGLRVTGYVRKGWTSKTAAETFTVQTHDFILENIVIIEKEVEKKS